MMEFIANNLLKTCKSSSLKCSCIYRVWRQYFLLTSGRFNVNSFHCDSFRESIRRNLVLATTQAAIKQPLHCLIPHFNLFSRMIKRD